ncbi:fatty acid synthase S-acetyltransferase [Penicillium chermesinum]|nr:fatty acid synthase S-acetyltransferase [Penicillium chermesinum]
MPPIAIVGAAFRLPGNVRSMDSLWELLLSQKDVSTEFPRDRFNIDAFYNETRSMGIKTRRGFFLNQDLDKVDSSVFESQKSETAQCDPQQRLLLEVIWECMENAGQSHWRGSGIGCYVGTFGEDWLEMGLKDSQAVQRAHVFGTGDFALANRVSFEYDLRGPSMTIKTGCSASLVGLHEACQSIASGDCSAAIVAGSNIILTPTMARTMSQNMVLAADGKCKTFDANADGYGRGEAINAIFIKRLDDAIRDRDPIRAIIRATATNSNGRSSKMAVPSAGSQEALIRKAYKRAGIADLSETGLFECHGTGTAAGDAAEGEAIARIFGGKGIYIGAVKPSIGHSEGASGLTSIAKAILCLEHKAIPPAVQFKTPSPNIPFEKAGLRVAQEVTSWPADRAERISVNSFGIGGSNAHVILDSPRTYNEARAKSSLAEKSPSLLVLSAFNPESLKQKRLLLADHCKDRKVTTRDLAYTLGERRDHSKYRGFCIVSDEILVDVPELQMGQTSNTRPGPLVFVLNGQGSQWHGMGRDLVYKFSVFREVIKQLDSVLQALSNPPSWKLEDKLTACDDPSSITKAEFAQPMCAAIQIGLLDLLSSWNIRPSLVIGHSSGEIAAAYATGAVSAASAIIVAYYRGQASGSTLRKGGMAGVGLGCEAIAEFLEEGVIVACENSPQSVVISGDEDALDRTIHRVAEQRPDTFIGCLDVETAYHSHHMVEVGPLLETLLQNQDLDFLTPQIPFYSTVFGRVLTKEDKIDAAYWRQNLESTVRFSTAVQIALDDLGGETPCFLEVGPHSPLSGPLRQIFQEKVPNSAPPYVSTLQKGKDQLWLRHRFHGYKWRRQNPHRLPPYPWNYDKKHWTESRISKSYRHSEFPHNELLGHRVAETGDIDMTWRNVLSLDASYIAMAGEAIRQVTGTSSYSIRNLFIKNALLLSYDKSVEIVTSLKSERLTDILDSTWYRFTISSYDGETWTRHCTGEARASNQIAHSVSNPEPFKRKVNPESWYRTLKKLGMQYGPHFQGLEDVTADPNGQSATATIVSNGELPEFDAFAVHPTVIDKALQLVGIAASKGLSRNLDRIAVPISIDSIEATTCHALQIHAESKCQDVVDGGFVGDTILAHDGQYVLEIHGLRCFAVEDETMEGDMTKSSRYTCEDWKPDIEFLPSLDEFVAPKEFGYDLGFRDINRYACILLLREYAAIKEAVPATDALSKYKDWVENQMQIFRQGGYNLVPEIREWVFMSDDEKASLASSMWERLKGTDSRILAFVNTLNEVFSRGVIKEIIEGRTSALEILTAGDGLENLYNGFGSKQVSPEFVALLGHAKPDMKVLEIGAGTGGTTAPVLEALRSRGSALYAEYVFTDISAGFFLPAKEKFKAVPGITYKQLDISQDPSVQGFEPGEFDFIIAANVLHATPCLKETLANVEKLLAPGGYFFLQELDTESIVINSIMGLLPGWWLGEKDNRAESPLVSPERWDSEIRSVGFTGIEATGHDFEAPYNMNANMIIRKPPPQKPEKSHIGLLYGGKLTKSIRDISEVFVREGYDISWFTLNDATVEYSCVVSLLDVDTPFLKDIDESAFVALRDFLSSGKVQSLLWITHGSQMYSDNPYWSLALGLRRVLEREYSLPFATVELDAWDKDSLRCLLKIQTRLQQGLKSQISLDYEYAISDKQILICRHHQVQIPQEGVSQPTKVKKLVAGTGGLLDTLKWVDDEERAPGSGEVEVDIRYVGLNFKDMMIAMGFIGRKDVLGSEATGVISRIGEGPHAQDFKIGDRVCIVQDGLLRTRIVVPSVRCLILPQDVSLDDGATIPCVYATVFHSLITLGKLERGQSVLVHSACGGVGLAAINLCQSKGAEIYATVGSETKAQYLVDKFHIPRHRIFNSRTPAFKEDVLRETSGKGVDIVLNSLSGELLHASWECVKEFGSMMEIGKRDMMGHGKLNLDRFMGNRSFFGIDLNAVLLHEEKLKSILGPIAAYFDQEEVKPIEPKNVFEAKDVEAAFRFMQTGQHIGKILIKIPEDETEVPCSSGELPLKLSPNSSYLLAGGLGGLGLPISRWMVERGARSLVFLSRSADQTVKNREAIQELQSMGCTVDVIQGSVAEIRDVQRAVSACPRPLSGVINLAMVMQDANFSEMTYDNWTTSLAPKVVGNTNLYEAVQGFDLDFFVIFGSVIAFTGNIGQANYAAANCFVDAFAKYARSKELPACAIHIGGLDEIGYVSERPELVKMWRNRIMGSQDPPGLSHCGIRCSKLCDESGISSDRLTIRPMSPCWGPTFGISDLGRIDKVHKFLEEVKADPSMLLEESSRDFIVKELVQAITAHSGDEGSGSPEEIAIDSLMVIEIRSWLRKRLALDIPTLLVTKVKNVGGLATLIIEKLQEKYLPSGDVKSEEGETEGVEAS